MAKPSTTALHRIPAATARRLLLGAQGLLDEPRRKATPDVLYDLIERMGFVQVDSINVVARAHHLTLASRLQSYRPALLERLLESERSLFEHWTHDASAIPTVWYRFWKPRFERYRQKVMDHPWWLERIGTDPEKLFDHVRQRIVHEGPLMTRDFEDERPAGTDKTWWGWKPHKAALEYLWRTGELAIAGRVNFHKVYDLAERVLPARAHRAGAERSRAPRLGLPHGPGTAGSRHGVRARQLLARRLAGRRARLEPGGRGAERDRRGRGGSGGRLRPRRGLGDSRLAGAAAALPPAPPRVRLLSPFDPILRDRKRTLRLFNFDYHFEAFVPGPKRQHGYYVLADPGRRPTGGPAGPQAPPREGFAGDQGPVVGAGRCARTRAVRRPWKPPSNAWRGSRERRRWTLAPPAPRPAA